MEALAVNVQPMVAGTGSIIAASPPVKARAIVSARTGRADDAARPRATTVSAMKRRMVRPKREWGVNGPRMKVSGDRSNANRNPLKYQVTEESPTPALTKVNEALGRGYPGG